MTEHSSSMPAALRRRREYAGPVLFSYGFRPFFLGGALWAALAVLLWLPQYFGELSRPPALTPLDWHIHEMLYGYVAAIVTGFLLTAIPNWTGRFPVNGLPLAALAALWLAGRVAVPGSAVWGAALPAATGIAFLAPLPALAAPEGGRRAELAQSSRSHRAGHTDRRQCRVSRRSDPARQRRLRHPHRHRGGDRPYHADRRTHHTELHAQLAGAEQSGPAAATVFSLRRVCARRERAGPRDFDRNAAAGRVRRRVDDRRIAAGRAACALGRRAYVRRSSRSHSPCWLRLRADRLHPARRGDPVACRVADKCGAPCLDCRRNRSHDACG